MTRTYVRMMSAVLPDSAAVPEAYHQRQFALPAGATEVCSSATARRARAARASRSRCSTATATRRSRPRARRRRSASPSASRASPGRPVRHHAAAHRARPRRRSRSVLGLEPVVVPELREVSLGEWEGGEFRIRMAEGDPVALQAVAEERWEVIPGAETMESLARACAPAIEAIVAAAGADVTRRRDRARRRDRRGLPPGDRQPPVRVRALRQRLAHAARRAAGRRAGCCARSTTRARHLA